MEKRIRFNGLGSLKTMPEGLTFMVSLKRKQIKYPKCKTENKAK